VSSAEPEAQQGSSSRQRWLWVAVVAAILVIAGVVGTAAGMWLGARQGLSAQSAGGRPTIVVPAAIASLSPSPVATRQPTVGAQTSGSPAEAVAEYVVQPGDTLRSIAQDHYGDASQWPRIYDANRDVIGSDPDALQAGTTLKLP
jgi:nucleoid-associated protein YgaU